MNAGMFTSDSHLSQISLSQKQQSNCLAISQWLDKEWKEWERRGWKREHKGEEAGEEMNRG